MFTFRSYRVLKSVARTLTAVCAACFLMLTATAGWAQAQKADKIPSEWKSEELDMLGMGLSVGDVDGDGANEFVIVDPTTVYVFKILKNAFSKIAEYSPSSLELKCVDTYSPQGKGPERIYVSAQNRGSVASFVLQYGNGTLTPVVENIPYFLRVIQYPTRGKILLGQRKGLNVMYEGPVMTMKDSGDSVVPEARFGVPLKIPVFGFVIGDFTGTRDPLIAAYDREDHLRMYNTAGKRLFATQDFYGGSDIKLRWAGPEKRVTEKDGQVEEKPEFFRPRLLALDLYNAKVHELLASHHSSKTRRFFSHTKMLEEGRIVGLEWNGEALTEAWSTPKVQGMITDFSIVTGPGGGKLQLVALERKKTDWFALLKSRSLVRIYDLEHIRKTGREKESEK